MSHSNDGKCQKCAEVFDRFPGFHEPLKNWFMEFQMRHPEAHISCAGRGRVEQEKDFFRGASKAHYGQSAHNFNAAIDLFVEIAGSADLYPRDWFLNVLCPEIPEWVDWGWHWTHFPEMPHLEVENWKQLRDMGALKLVE